MLVRLPCSREKSQDDPISNCRAVIQSSLYYFIYIENSPELRLVPLTLDLGVLMCTQTALDLLQFLRTVVDVVTTRRERQQLVH